MRASRRTDTLLFVLALTAFAYFHQGGGWSQNVRFAMVRAMVEAESFAIDDYLVYGVRPDDAGALMRLPLRRARFERDGHPFALAWRDTRGQLTPIDAEVRGTAPLVAVEDVAASGDVAYDAGHFHPNKAPGTSFLAVPGYAVLHAVERLLGLDVDRWAVLTFNAWMVSVLSLGIVSALGVVVLTRLARALAPERDAVLTALVFAFGTMHWPHATFLFEHNVIAVGVLVAFYAVERARMPVPADQDGLGAVGWLVAAGVSAGWAAITNYAFAPLVVLLGLFAIARVAPPWRSALWFGVGVLGPLALVCFYHWRCFGTPFTTNYAHQNQMFVAESRFLGVFALPRLDVLATLLVSPFRGIFFTSPVLVMGLAGLVLLWRGGGPRTWAWLITAAAAFPFLLNASFNGWDGGYTAVPRYVAPAVPFLALPIALAWGRWPIATGVLAGVAVVIHLLLTAVDPQVPIGDLGLAGVAPRAIWRINPIGSYVLPLFVQGRPWPLIAETVERAVERADRQNEKRGVAPEERARRAEQMQTDLMRRAAAGDPSRLALAGIVGPVSANPTGLYEGDYFRLTPPDSSLARGNSFNVGELLLPASRWSLVPLLALAAVLVTVMLRGAAAPAPDRP